MGGGGWAPAGLGGHSRHSMRFAPRTQIAGSPARSSTPHLEHGPSNLTIHPAIAGARYRAKPSVSIAKSLFPGYFATRAGVASRGHRRGPLRRYDRARVP